MLANILMSGAMTPVRRLFPRPVRTFVAELMASDAYADLINMNGSIKPTGSISNSRKVCARTRFQHKEKADVAMAAATSWYGGDYMEFGSVGLNTFRNFLSAFDLSGSDERYPDTRFYAFDVFGNLSSENTDVQSAMSLFDDRTRYFKDQFPHGDELARHNDIINRHGLFVEKCELIQGYFQDTLTKERARRYSMEGREIGFAFIDCNFAEFYETVFEFIVPLMAHQSYIYMDEYFQAAQLPPLFEKVRGHLKQRGIETVYVRPAGAFGALFRLIPAAT